MILLVTQQFLLVSQKISTVGFFPLLRSAITVERINVMVFHHTSSFSHVVPACGKHSSKYVIVYHTFILFEVNGKPSQMSVMDIHKSPD